MNIFKKSAIAIAAVSLIASSGCAAGVDQTEPITHTNYVAVPMSENTTSASMQQKLDNTVLIRTGSIKLTQEVKNSKKPIKNPPPIIGNGASLDSYGSGWIRQGTNKIITAEHVIDGEDVVQVQLNDGRKFLATVVYADKVSDMAEIEIDASPLPEGFQVCKQSPGFGDRVTAIGYPLGISVMVHEGNVANPSVTDPIIEKDLGMPSDINAMSVDMDIEPGFSGGPIITDSNCVAGVSDFILNQQEEQDGPFASLYFTTSTATLNTFISQADNPSLRPAV